MCKQGYLRVMGGLFFQSSVHPDVIRPFMKLTRSQIGEGKKNVLVYMEKTLQRIFVQSDMLNFCRQFGLGVGRPRFKFTLSYGNLLTPSQPTPPHRSMDEEIK